MGGILWTRHGIAYCCTHGLRTHVVSAEFMYQVRVGERELYTIGTT